MTHAQGAYGYRITGLRHPSPWLGPVPPAAPELLIRHAVLAPDPLPNETGRRFTLVIDQACRLRVERDPPTLVVESVAPPADALAVHPYLSYAAATHAQWAHGVALHGGVVAIDGRAWVLLADSLGGKTSMLAALWQRGFDVLSDDLAVIDRDHRVRSGPRCLDLRPDAFRALCAGAAVTEVRGRCRVTLDLVAPSLPLGGFVHLRWTPQLAIGPVTVAERTAILVDSRTAWGPSSAPALLDVVGVPFVALSRPRAFSALAASVDALLGAVCG